MVIGARGRLYTRASSVARIDVDHGARRRALLALTLACLACEKERPPLRGRYVLPPEFDAALPDAAALDRACALRATPAVAVASGDGFGRAVIAWSGTQYGIAWYRRESADAWIGFARVTSDGTPGATPARVTERGFTPSSPSLLWNGMSWSIVFEGGFGQDHGDIYQARVDARGTAVGSPWRMTRGVRDDLDPFLGARPQGFAFTWIAREDHDRSVLYGQLLDRWDAPRSLAVRLLDTTATLASPKAVWTGTQWAFTCISARSEVQAVDLARLDEHGLPTGTLRHASPDRIGGVETSSRYDIAWGGGSFGVVWSELREGATQVFFRQVSARGNALGPDVCVSEGAPSAGEPVIARVSEGVFAVAMRVEHEGLSRVWVRTVDANGLFQRGRVELQGADGQAGTPSVVFDGDALGVATATRTGVTFHRVTIGNCIAP